MGIRISELNFSSCERADCSEEFSCEDSEEKIENEQK